MLHQVRKANFRLKSRSRTLATDDRLEWQDWFEQELVGVLDELLSDWAKQAALADRVAEIKRLTLDLGLISAGQATDELRDRLWRQLHEQLALQTPRLVAPALSQLQNYLHFLRYGFWLLSEPADQLQQLERRAIEQPDFMTEIRQLLHRHLPQRFVWIRFFLQHSTPFLRQFVAATVSRGIEQAIAARDWRNQQVDQRDLAFIACYIEMTGLAQREPIEQALDRLESLWKPDHSSLLTLEPNIEIQALFSAQDLAPASPLSAELNLPAEDETAETPSSVLVQQAGVVLMFPLLESLFKKLGWLDAQRHIRMDKRTAALFALHFAVTGRQHADEPELLMNKLLLGMPLSQPAPREFDLGETCRHEIELMLKAIIGHWTALKNTSVDGLRDTFLQRQGSLLEEGDAYVLHVERKGFDVLLERLPWSIRVVALPWLKKPLIVDLVGT